MNYGDLIKDAFRVTWRHKYLWFFGFFVGGTGSNFAGNIPSGSGNFDGGDFEQSGAGTPGLAAQVSPFDNVALIIAVVVVVIIIALLLIAMNLISQGALSENVAALDRGEERRFGSGWRAGLGNIWRVLGYYIVLFLIGVGLFILISIPIALVVGGTFLATQSLGARIAVAVIAGLVGVALLVAVFIPLSIVGQYALREVVVRRGGVFASIRGGYGVFRRNIGRSLLLWLINLGLTIAVAIVLLIAFAIVGLILFLPTIGLAVAEQATAAVIAGIVAGVILLPILLVVSGATGAFFHSYWTLAYLRLTAPATREPLPTDPNPPPAPA